MPCSVAHNAACANENNKIPFLRQVTDEEILAVVTNIRKMPIDVIKRMFYTSVSSSCPHHSRSTAALQVRHGGDVGSPLKKSAYQPFSAFSTCNECVKLPLPKYHAIRRYYDLLSDEELLRHPCKSCDKRKNGLLKRMHRTHITWPVWYDRMHGAITADERKLIEQDLMAEEPWCPTPPRWLATLACHNCKCYRCQVIRRRQRELALINLTNQPVLDEKQASNPQTLHTARRTHYRLAYFSLIRRFAHRHRLEELALKQHHVKTSVAGPVIVPEVASHCAAFQTHVQNVVNVYDRRMLVYQLAKAVESLTAKQEVSQQQQQQQQLQQKTPAMTGYAVTLSETVRTNDGRSLTQGLKRQRLEQKSEHQQQQPQPQAQQPQQQQQQAQAQKQTTAEQKVQQSTHTVQMVYPKTPAYNSSRPVDSCCRTWARQHNRSVHDVCIENKNKTHLETAIQETIYSAFLRQHALQSAVSALFSRILCVICGRNCLYRDPDGNAFASYVDPTMFFCRACNNVSAIDGWTEVGVRDQRDESISLRRAFALLSRAPLPSPPFANRCTFDASKALHGIKISQESMNSLTQQLRNPFAKGV